MTHELFCKCLGFGRMNYEWMMEKYGKKGCKQKYCLLKVPDKRGEGDVLILAFRDPPPYLDSAAHKISVMYTYHFKQCMKNRPAPRSLSGPSLLVYKTLRRLKTSWYKTKNYMYYIPGGKPPRPPFNTFYPL